LIQYKEGDIMATETRALNKDKGVPKNPRKQMEIMVETLIAQVEANAENKTLFDSILQELQTLNVTLADVLKELKKQ
jgi:hypothetical protein